MTDVLNPPNPATPPPATPPAPDAGTPPATPPPAAPAAPPSLEALRLKAVEAELEVERLKKEAHKSRETARKDRELLENFRKLVGADPAAAEDPKAALDRQKAEAERREREDTLKERAVLRRLVGTNLEPGVVDLVAPALMRGIKIDESGEVVGLDEAFKGLEPILSKLSGKVAPPAPAALPNPPNPGAAARPLDPVFAAVKTFRAYVDLPLAAQDRFAAEHPDVLQRLRDEHEQRLARAGH